VKFLYRCTLSDHKDQETVVAIHAPSLLYTGTCISQGDTVMESNGVKQILFGIALIVAGGLLCDGSILVVAGIIRI
jgi:hypothetical protein